MSTQPLQRSLFDAEILTQAAIDRVADHADTDWLSAALQALRRSAQDLPSLTTDDVWERIQGPWTHERRAMGAVTREGVRLGWIQRADEWRKSIRPECHRRPLQVWRSKLRSGE